MKRWKTVMWSTMSIAALGALGCDRGPQQVVEQQAPQQQPAAEQQPQYVVAQQAPPALIVESQPAAPSPLDVWIAGYWNWDNQRYNWQAGHYEAPPQSDVVWVAPRYDADPHGYRYTPGKWTKKSQGNDNDHDHGRN